MYASATDIEPLSADERHALKLRLRRAERMGRGRAYAAVAPLLLFIVATQFPNTLRALAVWDKS